MPLLLARIVLTLVMMSTIVRAMQSKRCGCPQCNDIVEGLRRCECCVYLLNGKRSVDIKRHFRHAFETTEVGNEAGTYDEEDHVPADFRSTGEYGRSLTDTSDLLTTSSRDYITDRASALIPDAHPLQGTLRKAPGDVDGIDRLWNRVLRYVNKRKSSEDTYLFLV